jgi:hypothetical protein
MAWEYSKNKKCIYNWRNNNKEKYNYICKLNMRKYNAWNRIKKEFLNILI